MFNNEANPNKETPKERFTGIFIPAEILHMEGLSPIAMILLSWIDALHDEKYGGCWASNAYLAKKLKLKENTIAKIICDLRKLKLIEDVSFDGRIRVFKSTIYKVISKCQSKAALDLNPRQPVIKKNSIGKKSNPALDKNPTKSKDEIKDEIQKEIYKEKGNVASSSPASKLLVLGDEFKKVRLTEEQLDKLIAKHGEAKIKEMINNLDVYIAQKGDKYKCHYAAIYKWIGNETISGTKVIAKHRENYKSAYETEIDNWTPDSISTSSPVEDNHEQL